jgi:hypothetical protein
MPPAECDTCESFSDELSKGAGYELRCPNDSTAVVLDGFRRRRGVLQWSECSRHQPAWGTRRFGTSSGTAGDATSSPRQCSAGPFPTVCGDEWFKNWWKRRSGSNRKQEFFQNGEQRKRPKHAPLGATDGAAEQSQRDTRPPLVRRGAKISIRGNLNLEAKIT